MCESMEISTDRAKRIAALALGDVPAAILAGGFGTRLRPVVGERQKVLAEIGGRPFILHLLDQLASAGTRDVVLCVGYQGMDVQNALGDSYRSLSLRYSHEPEPLGTAGALRLALDLVHSDTVLVMNGDSFCDADFPAFLAEHRQRGAMASILLVQSDEPGRYGQLSLDEAGWITRFDEKPAPSGSNPHWINAGCYLINRPCIESIPQGHPVSLEREVFPSWIGRGLLGVRTQSRFVDMGTPDGYAAAHSLFLRKPV